MADEATAVSSGPLEDLPREEPFEGVVRHTLDTERATVTVYDFEPGAAFPLHRHPQQQITIVERGEIEFSLPNGAIRLEEGGWSVAPPDVEHGIVAGASGARIVAIIVPARAPGAYTLS